MKKIYKIITIILVLIIIAICIGQKISNIQKNVIENDNKFSTAYTQPYLPAGFSYLEGTDLEKGLVIEDEKGNQYVWIDVSKTTEVYQTAGLNITKFTDDEYVNIEKDLHTYTSAYRNGTSYIDDYPEEIVEKATGLTKKQYIELKQKMLKSIYQNGGFYIGRYETGTTNICKNTLETPTEIPVIQAEAYPYGFVTCRDAQKLASDLESGKYTTSLLFGVQWDLVLKYLENKGTTQEELNIDSANWGNHYNSLWNEVKTNSKYYLLDESMGENWIKQPYGEKKSEGKIFLSTGASDQFMKQNIYDLAGNSWEFTLEYSSDINDPCTIRGGSYGHRGDTDSASYRKNCSTKMYFFSFGFRVAIY